MNEIPRTDPLHTVRIPVRWSAWLRIQEEAKAERREATAQAALILERHAARRLRKPPTEQVA